MKKKTDKPAREPVAISYVRFSSPEQRKGDSLRRQTEATEAWCQRNGMALDRDLSCKDEGRSAFHGRHRDDKAALGQFLKLAQGGKVPRGSYLLIENLDRLSREDEVPACHLLTSILMAGVKVVQLSPSEMVLTEKSNGWELMRAVMELSRGHNESEMKSKRALGNWEAAVRRAREGRIITLRLPAWVEVEGGAPRLVEARAAVVRRIFKLAAEGYGMASIVKKLNADKVPPFGACEADGEGRRKKTAAAPFGCGEWRTSYVRSILTDRRAIGELQPRDRARQAKGEPIKSYYPNVVSEQQFYSARVAVTARKNRGADAGATANRQGRIGVGVPNLFSGLLRDARDGSTYYVGQVVEGGAKTYRLLSKGAIEGQLPARTFSYAVFERALLSGLRELTPAQLFGAGGAAFDADAVRAELERVRAKKGELAAELLKGNVAVIAEVLRGLEAQEGELAARLEGAEEEAARPMAEVWRDATTLAGMLDKVPPAQREDVRLRLRSALRRAIDSVWLLVVPRGRVRLLECQVFFAGGEGAPYRRFLIAHRPAWKGRQGSKPAVTGVRTIKHPDAALAGVPLDVEDLRDRDQAGIVERFLAGLTPKEIDTVLSSSPR